MSGPVRVQLRRTKGWRMPEKTVHVARPGRWGNPWTVKAALEAGYGGTKTETASWCVSLYREWLTGEPDSITRMFTDGEARVAALREALPTLRGLNLACWCPLDAPCHADVLLELANTQQSRAVSPGAGTAGGHSSPIEAPGSLPHDLETAA